MADWLPLEGKPLAIRFHSQNAQSPQTEPEPLVHSLIVPRDSIDPQNECTNSLQVSSFSITASTLKT